MVECLAIWSCEAELVNRLYSKGGGGSGVSAFIERLHVTAAAVRAVCKHGCLVRVKLYRRCIAIRIKGRDLFVRVLSVAHGGVLSIAIGHVFGFVLGRVVLRRVLGFGLGRIAIRRVLGFGLDSVLGRVVLDGVSGLLICLGRVGLTVSLGSVPGLFLDLGNILCLCRFLSLRGRCLVALRESGEGQHAHEHREQQQNGQKRLP